MSRGSAQHPAQHPDDYPTERPASRRADYASQQSPGWGRDERPQPGRAEYPTQEFPGWGRDERHSWGPGESPAARRADYPAQDLGWGRDERPSWGRDERRADYSAHDRAWGGDKPSTAGRADYPSRQYLGWGMDERRTDYSAWDRAHGGDERLTWGRDEPRAAGRAEYPTQEFPGWGGDERPSRGGGERPSRGRGERPSWGPEGLSSWGRDERSADYPTQDRAQDGDEYPTQDRAWSGDERPTDDSARDEDGQPASHPAQRPAGSTSHRKPTFARSALRRPAVWMTAAVVLAAAAGLVVGQKTHWPNLTSQPAALNRATAPSTSGSAGHSPAATPGRSPATGSGQPRNSRTGADGNRHSAKRPATGHRTYRRKHGIFAYYRNPMRAITGLLPERIDMGVDFGGSGKIYAIGKGVVVTAITGDVGWPGGGWMSYRLTAGPAAGQMVFVAEDITPTVTVGQKVTSKTVIANMFNGGAGIETGWAQSSGLSPESQAPEAGAIWGQGPFPTAIGMNFEELLQALGVPAGYGRDQSTFGTVPAGYPASW